MKRNDNDVDGSNSTERESLRRKAVLDDVNVQGRGPLADGVGRSAGRSNAGTTSRRSLLATAGALGATALSGCLGDVTGGTSEFDAAPVMLPIPAPEEQRQHGMWLALAGANRVSVTDEVSQYGLSRGVRATNWGATYVSTIDRETRDSLGYPRTGSTDRNGTTHVGEVSLVSTPRVEIDGKNLNPAIDLSPEDVLGTLRVGADGGDPANGGDGADGGRGGASVVREHDIDGFDREGRYLRRAYSGTVRALSDVRFSDTRARSFDAAAPAVFTAKAQLRDSRETPILGTIERHDYDENHVFKAGWIPVDDRERAIQAVEAGQRLVQSEIQQADVVERNGSYVVRLPDCNVSDFVQDCIDGCEGHDCKVRCLVKFAYMTVEEAERWLRWCPLIMFPVERYPPVEVVEDVGGVQKYDEYTHE